MSTPRDHRHTDLTLIRPPSPHCKGKAPDGSACPNPPRTSGYCTSCLPTSIRHLYSKGLDAAAAESLAALSDDPEIRSFAREIARWRLILDKQFARAAAIENVEERLRHEIAAGQGRFTDSDRALLKDYERIQGTLQIHIEAAANMLDKLRLLVLSHVHTTDGARIWGDVTVGDLMALLGGVISDVREECGDEKARAIADKIRARVGRLDAGLPAHAG